jgi:EmrB/QacA subfamily drug resistance transporter
MSLFMVGIDATIVNIALPAIHDDLKATTSQLQWTIDAYTLVIASLLMLSGSTADRLGRVRVFQVGLAIFSTSSLLCGLAPSAGWLIAFRALQAVGGSMLNPVAMSIIRNVFTDPRERAQAIGMWGGVVGLSMALGPVLGGALVEALGWRAVFLVNVPVAVAAIVLTARFVPESRAEHARRVDPIGQLLVMLVLGSLTYAIIEGPNHGWTSLTTAALFAVTVVGAAVLVGYERRRSEPLLELGFFRSVPFAGASLIALSAFAAFGGFLFLNTLYLQDARGYSALHAGLLTLPMAGMTLIVAPLSGRLVGRVGARPSLVVGGLGIAAGGAMLTAITATTSIAWLLVAYVLFGAGFGSVNPPITNTAISGMPPAQAGVAAAVASTSRQVGVSLGVAIVGVVGVSGSAAQLALASHPGWWIITSCGVLALVLGIVSTTKRAETTAARFGISESVPGSP